MNSKSHSSEPAPSFNELLDYAEGRLAEAEQKRIAEYIAQHPDEIAADWAWVRDFIKRSGAVELHPLPSGLEERLVSLYNVTPSAPFPRKMGELMGSIRRVVAELVDPGTEPALAASGLRSKSSGNTSRQWTFTIGQFDIWINALVRPDEHFDLHGQICPVAGEAFSVGNSVQLVRENRDSGLATVDDFGEFVIQNVPAGEYELIIAGKDTEIVCAPVTFGV